MQITTKILDAVKQSTQCLVVASFEGGKLSAAANAINAADASQLETLLKREKFDGKVAQSLLLLNPHGIAADRLLVIGFGALDKQGNISADNFRRALQKIPEALKPTPCTELSIILGDISVAEKDAEWQARQLAEIIITSQHRADGLKSKPAELSFLPTKVTLGYAKAQLAAATPALKEAIGQASGGADQLHTGAATLATGQQAALDGAGKLSEGAQTLDAGAGQLEAGAATAADGSRTLAGEISKGAGQVPNPDDQQKSSLSEVIADPVAVTNVSQAKADSYGAGLAPFFLTLALWIGIFMLIQAMRPITQRALASNAPAWKIAVGGWLPFFAVSVVQATLLTLVVNLGLGLNPAHPVLMWLFMLAAAMAFSAIIQGVVALLGSPGKLVVLILLVLQLVSSGGTFPWQTTPQPLHVVHEVLPMGYVVTGMRHLIYGADLSMILPTVAGLFGYTVLGAALSTLAVHKHKFWTLKSLKPEIAV